MEVMRWTTTLAWTVRVAWLAGTCLLGGGCAATRGIPLGFDIDKAGLATDGTPPAMAVVDPSGKPSPVTVGGLTGIGVGGLAGTALCLGTGPLFPLCMLTIGATTVAVGATSGVVAGAVASSGPQPVDPQQAMLTAAPTGYQLAFTEQVQRETHAASGRSLPMVDLQGVATPMDRASPDEPREWLAIVGVSQFAALKSPPEQPFAIRIEATLRLRRVRDAEPLYVSRHAVLTEATLTTAQWYADGGAALREGIEASLRRLAAEIAADLRDSPGAPRRASGVAVGYTR